PLLLNFRAVLLASARDLLLARQPQLVQGARDGHVAARDAEPLAQFLEGRIGLLSDQLPEPLQILRAEFRRVGRAMGFGLERAGAAVESQQPRDDRDADQEPTSDLVEGLLAALDGLEDPLSEILRQRCHRSPPHRDLLSNRAPTNCSAL